MGIVRYANTNFENVQTVANQLKDYDVLALVGRIEGDGTIFLPPRKMITIRGQYGSQMVQNSPESIFQAEGCRNIRFESVNITSNYSDVVTPQPYVDLVNCFPVNIRQLTLSNCRGTGIRCYKSLPDENESNSGDTSISYCIINGISGVGTEAIQILGEPENIWRYNYVYRNQITDFSKGIYMKEMNYIWGSNNKITNCGIGIHADELVNATTRVSWSRNTFTNCNQQILVTNDHGIV